MNLNLLFDNYELLLDTPEKIKELNQTILQFAVLGKLVPQNPADEPATDLIKRIKQEKAKLVKEGRIKQEKPLPPIKENEFPYEIPKEWEWVRLGEIGEINPRNNASDDLDASFTPMNLVSAEYGIHPEYELRSWGEIKNGYTHFQNYDVVVAKITPCFENSKAGIMKGLINKIGAGTTELHVFRGNPNSILPQYVYLYFKTPHFLKLGQSKMTGTAGQKRVPKDFIAYNPFPLPPLEEQKRIVEKVDKLLNRTKEIEAKLKEREEQSVSLNSSTLHHFLNSKSTEVFSERFQFIIDHFDLLYSDERNVKELKQAILQLAVQGKLVSQNPKDEPASELIKRIKKEKEKLIMEGKIKKEKPLPAIKQEEIPYELPQGWEWVRFGNVLNVKSSKRIYESDYRKNGVPFYRSKEIGELSKGNTILKSYYISDDKYHSIEKKFGVPSEGDLLMTSVGSIGNSWIVDNRKFYYKDGNITQIEKNRFINMRYIQLYIMGPMFKRLVDRTVSGTAYNALTIIKIKGLVLSIPPLDEQKRIVEKVDELMNLCDELETKLSKSKEASENLFRAILNGTLNNNFHRENTEASHSVSM